MSHFFSCTKTYVCVCVCVCLKYSYRIDAFESMSISNKYIVHICREYYTICHMSFLLNRILFLLIWQNSIKNWQRGKMRAWNEQQRWIFWIVFFLFFFLIWINAWRMGSILQNHKINKIKRFSFFNTKCMHAHYILTFSS